jgi:hypothetical protein
LQRAAAAARPITDPEAHQIADVVLVQMGAKDAVQIVMRETTRISSGPSSLVPG